MQTENELNSGHLCKTINWNQRLPFSTIKTKEFEFIKLLKKNGDHQFSSLVFFHPCDPVSKVMRWRCDKKALFGFRKHVLPLKPADSLTSTSKRTEQFFGGTDQLQRRNTERETDLIIGWQPETHAVRERLTERRDVEKKRRLKTERMGSTGMCQMLHESLNASCSNWLYWVHERPLWSGPNASNSLRMSVWVPLTSSTQSE